ncbi:MAG: prepilin-type N-terminal cleavage/methylation domain-containing protein [Gallionellaceae bacterium]|jgi:general secretion pathway protein H|nr:prepilin-type N-terminal cleavage/methylation domain-containing protein [Gallionellaceae bacterium]
MSFSKQTGFTLIELLVVMVIVGIALGVVTLRLLPDDRAVLRDEAERLALLLENAGQQARASGHALAWSYERGGYRFWQQNEYGDWIPADGDMLRPRTLPDGIVVSAAAVETDALRAGEPMAMSAASFALPFSIRLNKQQITALVTGDSAGVVTATLGNGVQP